MNIAVDFDGVIHDPNNVPKGKQMGQPMPGAVEAMQQLSHHNFVTIFTVRAAGPASTEAVHKWLDYFGIPHQRITNIKENFDLFIDDRAVRFIDWAQTLKEIDDRKIA